MEFRVFYCTITTAEMVRRNLPMTTAEKYFEADSIQEAHAKLERGEIIPVELLESIRLTVTDRQFENLTPAEHALNKLFLLAIPSKSDTPDFEAWSETDRGKNFWKLFREIESGLRTPMGRSEAGG